MTEKKFPQNNCETTTTQAQRVEKNILDNAPNNASENSFWIFTKEDFFDGLDSAVKTLVVFFILFTFVFSFSTVKETSMLPTLFDNDKVIIWELMYNPKFQDVVVVTQPNHRNHMLVKRVIATEGQTLDIDPISHKVLIDGKEISEPYIYEPTIMRGNMEYPLTVPKGKVFVMGDNRNDSLDSRSKDIGFVDEQYIRGRVVFRLFPFKRFGVIK